MARRRAADVPPVEEEKIDRRKKEHGGGKGGGKRIVMATEATFLEPDDPRNIKQAQYARLALFNYATSQKMVRDGDVNNVPDEILERAGLELISGNALKGTEGIAFITELTKGGGEYQSYDEVRARGLTKAYSMEVRPYIYRLLISDRFGRKARKAAETDTEEENGGENGNGEEEKAPRRRRRAATTTVEATGK